MAAVEHVERSKRAARPLSGALCPICGRVFVRFTANRRYCSRVCHSKSTRRRRQLEMLFALPDHQPAC